MNQFATVAKVLGNYFDALHHCDTDKLADVFHTKAIYATADESSFLVRNMPEYTKVIAERESPAARGEPRRDVIDGIEFAGDNTARARVRCSIGSRDFVDYLTLVRDEGRWQIIAKVFQIADRGV